MARKKVTRCLLRSSVQDAHNVLPESPDIYGERYYQSGGEKQGYFIDSGEIQDDD